MEGMAELQLPKLLKQYSDPQKAVDMMFEEHERVCELLDYLADDNGRVSVRMFHINGLREADRRRLAKNLVDIDGGL
jgi:hypothetical protein